jgi:hypothetical protein
VELTEDGDINIIGSSVKKADSIDLESWGAFNIGYAINVVGLY